MIVSRVIIDFEKSGWASQSKASARKAFERIARQEHHAATHPGSEPTLGQLLYRALIEHAVEA